MGLNFSYSHTSARRKASRSSGRRGPRGDVLRHAEVYGPYTDEEIDGEALRSCTTES
jgi:hypothetical protein